MTVFRTGRTKSKTMLVTGAVLHAYVFVAWFYVVLVGVRLSASSATRLPIVASLVAIAVVIALVWAIWRRAVRPPHSLEIFLLSPMLVTFLTAVRLSAAAPWEALSWIGSVVTMVVLTYAVATVVSFRRTP